MYTNVIGALETLYTKLTTIQNGAYPFLTIIYYCYNNKRSSLY